MEEWGGQAWEELVPPTFETSGWNKQYTADA